MPYRRQNLPEDAASDNNLPQLSGMAIKALVMYVGGIFLLRHAMGLPHIAGHF